MNSAAMLAAIGGVLVVVAAVAFFVIGRGAGRRAELQRQRAAQGTSEQTARRIVGEAEREAESTRKSAVLAGKEELIRLREQWEQEARTRREEIEQDERRV